jgi:hypothetical protein
MKVKVVMPAEVEVELVQMNEMRDYKTFQNLLNLILPTAAGFWVGWITTDAPSLGSPLLYSAVAFSIVAIYLWLSARQIDKKIPGRLIAVSNLANFHRDGSKGK